MKKNVKHLICLCILLLLSVPCFFKAATVHAAGNPPLVDLKPGVTYTKYDATGNQTPNKIQIRTKGNSYYISSVEIYISGKKALTLKPKTWPSTLKIQLCTLSNKKVYFFVEGLGDSVIEPFAGLYQMKDGKLKQVYNMRSLLDKRYTYKFNSYIQSVSGNNINLRYSAQNYTLSNISFNVALQYKAGKFILPTRTFKTVYPPSWGSRKNSWTASRSFPTYTTVSQTKKSFTVNKNDVVQINRIYIRSKILYVQVTRKDGKTGWFKGLTSDQYQRYGHDYYFKGTMVVG